MKIRLKRLCCFLLCVCLAAGVAGAEDLFSDAASDETVRDVTESTLIDTLNTDDDQVVNADPIYPDDDQFIEYSYTPLDVILILDVSGSMRLMTDSGQQVLTLAQEAAKVFVNTLFELSAPSRIGLVIFSDYAIRKTDTTMGLTDENDLIALIRDTHPEGMTNTGDALSEAGRFLQEAGRPDTRQVVILLTDGIPEGDGYDPVQSAINAGRSLPRNDRFIYTIGLVGGLDNSQITTARQVLNDQYATRYFEVDNRGAVGSGATITNMGSYTAITGSTGALAEVFASLVPALIAPDTGGLSYSVWANNLEIRVTDIHGTEYISSAPEDYRATASFGKLSNVGEDKSQKLLSMIPGDYEITMRGTRTGKGSYHLAANAGVSMTPSILCEENNINTHPAQVLHFSVRGSAAEKTDLSWDPLDHRATDPFTGQPTRGSEVAAPGKVTAKANLYAWADKKAAVLFGVNKGSYLEVLASNDDSSWLLVAAVNKDGKTARGWIEASAISTDGYVPKLIQDDAAVYTFSEAITASTAPSEAALEGRKIKQGETFTAVHAERDASGREWAYGLLSDKKATAVYVPANSLENWQSVSPEGFRIGYAMPTLVWQKTFGGNGYTEFMWAASELSGSGVAVSGRTDSSAKPLKAKNGGRDALAMVLTPDGEIGKSVILGGSDADSFHCIAPAADGYYVSGITRSNNKDFADIWDAATFSGKIKKTSGRSNALIGKLNPDLSVSWMKSFGSGDVSFGFDMVVTTADGNIAGCGWLTHNNGFIHQGYGGQDFLVIKLTDSGDLMHYAVLGDALEDVPDSAAATDDGGLMIVGKSYDGGSDQGRIFVLDENLQIASSVSYGGVREDLFDNIRNLGDGSYIVTGLTESYAPSMDYWAMQIDAEGRMIWSKTYGGSGKDEICGTALLPDGTTLLLGYTTSVDGLIQGATGKGKDAWALCIDQTGRVLWQYVANLPGDDWFNAAAVDPADGGIVLVGARDGKGNNAKGYIIKLLPPQLSITP